MARRLREETTTTLKSIAVRLNMATWTHVAVSPMKATLCRIPLLYIASMLLCCGCLSPRASDRSANEVLDAMTKNVEGGTVSRLTICFLPYNVRTVVSVGPEHLQQRPVLRTNLTIELRKDLVQALKGTRGQGSKYPPDCRWGAQLLGSDGTSVHTIYVDRRGRGAVLDGKIFDVNRSLFRWFERNFYRIGTEAWAARLSKEGRPEP